MAKFEVIKPQIIVAQYLKRSLEGTRGRIEIQTTKERGRAKDSRSRNKLKDQATYPGCMTKPFEAEFVQQLHFEVRLRCSKQCYVVDFI